MPSHLARIQKDPEFARLFAEEGLINTAQELLARQMQKQGVSKDELAKRLGVSKAAVTRLLGGRNPRLRELAAAMHALGASYKLTTEQERS